MENKTKPQVPKERTSFYPQKNEHVYGRIYLEKLPFETVVTVDMESGLQIIVFTPKKS